MQWQKNYLIPRGDGWKIPFIAYDWSHVYKILVVENKWHVLAKKDQEA